MNIGHAARQTGLTVKTIRCYEEIGLIRADRNADGYRDFGDAQISRLRFPAQARHMGFGLEGELEILTRQCHGNAAPDCAILNALGRTRDA